MSFFPKYLLLLCCLGVLLGTGCEKEVNIALPNGTPQLVVNGSIETGQPPVIVLTSSFGYFTTFDLQTFTNSFVHDATIHINNGSREINLREYALDTGSNFTFYLYTIDTADRSAFTFLGKVNESYKLSIVSNGKTYESTTRISASKPLDSIAALLPDRPDQNKPAARILNVYYSDPDTPGNCIRYFTSLNGGPFYTASTSVFDDGLVNGAGSARLPVFLGYNRSEKTNDSTGYLFPGDHVTIKWCTIERPVFNFYSTLEYSTSSVGNPFTSPINVRTNISNGALGIWAGYGVTTASLVVPQ